VTATRDVQRDLEVVLPRILGQYLPAGVGLSLHWRMRAATLSTRQDDDIFEIDANGPGALGKDSEIGRTVLVGRTSGRIDESGLNIDLRLQ
jgi:hypothetical protein